MSLPVASQCVTPSCLPAHPPTSPPCVLSLLASRSKSTKRDAQNGVRPHPDPNPATATTREEARAKKTRECGHPAACTPRQGLTRRGTGEGQNRGHGGGDEKGGVVIQANPRAAKTANSTRQISLRIGPAGAHQIWGNHLHGQYYRPGVCVYIHSSIKLQMAA